MSWAQNENKRCLFSRNILCRTWQPWRSCHLSLQPEIILWLYICMYVIVCMATYIFFQIQSRSLTSHGYQTPPLWHLFFMIRSKQISQVHTFLHYVRLWRETKVCINDMTTYKLVSHSNISFKARDPLPHHHTPHGGKHLKYNSNTFDSIAK